jgi:hypothetical protein
MNQSGATAFVQNVQSHRTTPVRLGCFCPCSSSANENCVTVEGHPPYDFSAPWGSIGSVRGVISSESSPAVSSLTVSTDLSPSRPAPKLGILSTQLYPARAPERACITVSPLTFQSMSLTGSFHDQVPPNGQPLTVTVPLKCPESVPLPSVVGLSPWRLIRCSRSFSAIFDPSLACPSSIRTLSPVWAALPCDLAVFRPSYGSITKMVPRSLPSRSTKHPSV